MHFSVKSFFNNRYVQVGAFNSFILEEILNYEKSAYFYDMLFRGFTVLQNIVLNLESKCKV